MWFCRSPWWRRHVCHIRLRTRLLFKWTMCTGRPWLVPIALLLAFAASCEDPESRVVSLRSPPNFLAAVGPGVWTTKAPMPTPRTGLAAGVVNGILYAVGGNDGVSFLGTVEAYDPATNTWTTKASMPTVRTGLATGVVNGILYAVGGNNGSFLATVEAFDPAERPMTNKTTILTDRTHAALGVDNAVRAAG